MIPFTLLPVAILAATAQLAAAQPAAQPPGRTPQGDMLITVPRATDTADPIVRNKPVQIDASITVTRTLADGNEIVTVARQQLLRNSDGRTLLRTWSAIPQGVPAGTSHDADVVVLRDPARAVTVHLYPRERLMLRQDLRATPAPAGAATAGEPAALGSAARVPDVLIRPGDSLTGLPPSSPTLLVRPFSGADPGQPMLVPDWTQTPIGKTTLLGAEVSGTRARSVIAAGRVGNKKDLVSTVEQWFSSELSLVLRSTHVDPLMGKTEYVVHTLTRSDPDPVNFEVPSGYRTLEPPPIGPIPTVKPLR